MRNQRGIALVSVLFLLLGLLILSATLFFTTFVDLQSTANTAAAIDGFYIAEAGIHHLWSILEPAPDFAEALAWPSGVPPMDSPTYFPNPPQTYRVRTTPGADESLIALSEGTSGRGTRSRVEATFRREQIFRPAAVVVIGASVTSASVAGSVEVEGADRDGAERGLVTIGAESQDAAQTLRSALPNDPVVVVGLSGLEAAGVRLRSSPDMTLTGPFGNEVWGTADRPLVVKLTGDATIDGDVRSAGVVLANAPVRVNGLFEVEGTLLATQGLEINGILIVRGSIWLAESLAISGSGSLMLDYASTALARADALRPGIFPRTAILGAWREVW
jgi:hypothetical protein